MSTFFLNVKHDFNLGIYHQKYHNKKHEKSQNNKKIYQEDSRTRESIDH